MPIFNILDPIRDDVIDPADCSPPESRIIPLPDRRTMVVEGDDNAGIFQEAMSTASCMILKLRKFSSAE